MAAKLDRSRAFATVTGILEGELSGACFWQDGKHFTASGDELNPTPEPEVVPVKPVVQAVEKPKAKSKDTSDLDLL